jgi:hypothetical protein
MAVVTDDEGLPLLRSHSIDPCRFSTRWVSIQIRELADVVNLYRPFLSTKFTASGEKPLDDFAPDTPDRLRWAVINLGPFVPAQWYGTKVSHKGLFRCFTRNLDADDFILAFLDREGRAVPRIDTLASSSELICQRLNQGYLRHSLQSIKRAQVVCHAVVLDEATILRLVLGHDAIRIIDCPLGKVDRFSASHVAGASVLYHSFRDTKADAAIDATVTSMVMLVISVQYLNFISQEASLVVPGVGDQGLFRAQIELQLISQERGELLFDLLGFILWSCETQEEVSGAGGSHPRALAEPDMTLSRHPAPIVRPRP